MRLNFSTIVWILSLLIFAPRLAVAETVKELAPIGPQPSILDSQGSYFSLYKASYALLVSESHYKGLSKQGWRPLDATSTELDQVAVVLQKQGFKVTRVSDATSDELTVALKSFMGQFGHDKDNRLVIFFSGHGYTDKDSQMGYIVPIDADDPNINSSDFYSKAIPIQEFQTLAQSVNARHVLFLFDSCFSGSIFMSKGGATEPEVHDKTTSFRQQYFLQAGQKPVRQFIAAGGPDQEVPAVSYFVPLFIEAVEGGASSSNDGYVTGKEIGSFIEQKLPSYNHEQSPHSDVIRDARFTFGDMVFQPHALQPASSLALSSASPQKSDLPLPDAGIPSAKADQKSEAASQKLETTGIVSSAVVRAIDWKNLSAHLILEVPFKNEAAFDIPQTVRDLCDSPQFTNDGRIVSSPTKNGIGFFDVRTGNLLQDIAFRRVIDTCPGNAKVAFFANTTRAFVEVQDYKVEPHDSRYITVNLDTFLVTQLSVPKDEYITRAIPNEDEDSLIIVSQKLTNSEQKHNDEGTYIIRNVRSDGSVITERRIRRDFKANSLWFKVNSFIENPSYYKSHLTQGFIFFENKMINAKRLTLDLVFDETSYQALGCSEETKYLLVSAGATTIKSVPVNGKGSSHDLEVCIIVKNGAQLQAKSVFVKSPPLVPENTEASIFKVLDKNILILNAHEPDPDRELVWAYNLSDGTVSDIHSAKIDGNLAPSGDFALTYFSRPDNSIGLYMVKLQQPLF